MRRGFAILLLFVMSGCCSSWRAGTPELRGAEYDPSLEPWVAHGVRAERKVRKCFVLIDLFRMNPNYQWHWPGSPEGGPMVSSTSFNVRLGVRRAFLRDGDDPDRAAIAREQYLAFTETNDVAVVGFEPWYTPVFLTWPDDDPHGWDHGDAGDIGAGTVVVTDEVPSVWQYYDGYKSEALVLGDGEQHRVAVQWGVLVITRNGDTYSVTTEGVE